MTRHNLTKGFRELRKHGYFAKQNFSCCQTCGWCDVPEEKKDKVVFYHKQDNEDKEEGNPFYLCWNGDGKEIQGILQKCGVETEWNGDETKRIRVTKW